MRVQRLLSVVTFLAAMAVTSTAMAVPLSIGDLVTVGNTQGNAFTPSPVASDPNGLYSGVGFILNGGSTVNTSAGLFVLDYTHDVPSSSASSWTQFLSFCLEPNVYLTPFSNPYSVQTVGSAGYDSARISELWGRYRDIVDTDIEAAAFQVVLWELSYGSSDLNLTTGAFRLANPTSAAGTLATQWLNSLNGTGTMASGLVVLVNNPNLADRQDLITQVPEPVSLALLGFGLVGLGFAKRRKQS